MIIITVIGNQNLESMDKANKMLHQNKCKSFKTYVQCHFTLISKSKNFIVCQLKLIAIETFCQIDLFINDKIF